MMTFQIYFIIPICLVVTVWLDLCHGLALQKVVKIQVCQNKDCCQRFQGTAQTLPQTIQHLIHDDDVIVVESTGCLSQCGKGPNLCIGDAYHGNVVNTDRAGAVLELSDISIHSTLVAAVNVMERAAQASSLEEKERFLTSVISTLEKKNLGECMAMAHAYAMRAKVRLESKQYPNAVQDAQLATRLNPTNDLAWRTLADGYIIMDNAPSAVQALQSWSKANPKFATKAKKEIQRLQKNP